MIREEKGSKEQSANLKSEFSLFEFVGVMAVNTIIMTMLVMSTGGIRPAADSKAAQSEIILRMAYLNLI